jgi:hypothetical protein
MVRLPDGWYDYTLQREMPQSVLIATLPTLLLPKADMRSCESEAAFRRPAAELHVLTEHTLWKGGTDDDLCTHGGNTNLSTRVPILSQLPGQELVQLGIEHAICHKLRVVAEITKRSEKADIPS